MRPEIQLLHLLKAADINISRLAKALGIRPFLFKLKLHGLVDFGASEVVALSAALGSDVIGRIFFGNIVDFKSTTVRAVKQNFHEYLSPSVKKVIKGGDNVAYYCTRSNTECDSCGYCTEKIK